jgi:hypothetical protein
MPLDFTSAARLFMGTEEELAAALGLAVGDLRAARATPNYVNKELTEKLGRVLIERAKGMARVGEMLMEDGK